MMGRLNHDQGEFFYSFRLDEAVPDDHQVRAIAAVLVQFMMGWTPPDGIDVPKWRR